MKKEIEGFSEFKGNFTLETETKSQKNATPKGEFDGSFKQISQKQSSQVLEKREEPRQNSQFTDGLNSQPKPTQSKPSQAQGLPKTQNASFQPAETRSIAHSNPPTQARKDFSHLKQMDHQMERQIRASFLTNDSSTKNQPTQNQSFVKSQTPFLQPTNTSSPSQTQAARTQSSPLASNQDFSHIKQMDHQVGGSFLSMNIKPQTNASTQSTQSTPKQAQASIFSSNSSAFTPTTAPTTEKNHLSSQPSFATPQATTQKTQPKSSQQISKAYSAQQASSVSPQNTHIAQQAVPSQNQTAFEAHTPTKITPPPSKEVNSIAQASRSPLEKRQTQNQDEADRDDGVDSTKSTQSPTSSTQESSATIGQPAPISTSKSAQMQEIVTQMIDQLTTLTHSDKTDTVMTLSKPPAFAGAQIVISEFKSANKEFNLSFNNLSSEAMALLNQQESSQLLRQGFEQKGFALHIVQFSEQASEALFTQAQGNDTFRDGQGNGQGSDQGGGQGDGKGNEGNHSNQQEQAQYESIDEWEEL